MSIVVAGFDLHRTQITYEALDRETGELLRGRIRAAPDAVSEWVARFPAREVHVAVEACTGWWFVHQALLAAGAICHLAEPAETRARRGPKRRAKTDGADARWLRTLLEEGRLPESWIPPEHICELRTRTRLRHTLVQERTAWQQRARATLFHHGIQGAPERLRSAEGRPFLAGLELPAASRERIALCLRMIERLEEEIHVLDLALRRYTRRQPGARALSELFGVGPISAPTILAELGDAARLRRSRAAVRLAGLDIGVHRSDGRARVGRLTRQGSAHLRWALYEAAEAATRPASPDHADYLALRERRLSHTQATMTIARKIARRAYHTLRQLGEEALAPVPVR
jgi:transposase